MCGSSVHLLQVLLTHLSGLVPEKKNTDCLLMPAPFGLHHEFGWETSSRLVGVPNGSSRLVSAAHGELFGPQCSKVRHRNWIAMVFAWPAHTKLEEDQSSNHLVEDVLIFQSCFCWPFYILLGPLAFHFAPQFFTGCRNLARNNSMACPRLPT